MNDVSLYDGGDTGLSFPEFKPRQFTKSEPAQRRNLKTVIFESKSGITTVNVLFALFAQLIRLGRFQRLEWGF